MNTIKKLMLSASLLVLAFAGMAQAQVTFPIPGGTPIVRITGSTAYRAAVHQAILSLLGATNATAYNNSGSSGLAGANQAIFYGTYNSSLIIIKTDWTGSVGGIKALTQNLSLFSSGTVSAWLDNSNLSSGTAAGVAGSQTVDTTTFPGSPNGILNFKPTGGTDVNAVPPVWETITTPPQVADVGFSDAFQNTTLYSSTNLGATAQTTTGAGAIVGLVDFVWIKNAALNTDPDYTAWTHLTNVTPNLLRQLYTNGHAPISLFTGNSADYPGANLYAVGRDEDSGTRINAFAEDYLGVNATPKQYYASALGTGPSANGSDISTGSVSLFPAQTVEGTSEPLGHSGFSSGGKIAAEMSSYGTDTLNGSYFLTYIGLDDATSFLTTTSSSATNPNAAYVPGTFLTWNGVAFSPAAIEQGQYSFWGYEHMYYRTGSITAGGQTVAALSSANPAGQTLADALATDLSTTDQLVASGVPLSAMQVSRTVEGGTITHN